MPTGLGSEGRGFLQPLSLRCIFYKGAAAGAGFHSSLSVCLGLRRCWISVFGNVVGPAGSREGSGGACGVCRASLPVLFPVCDSLCCEPKGKKEGIERLLLGIQDEAAQEARGGITWSAGGWIWMESFLRPVVSYHCGLRPMVVAGL